MYQQLYVLLIIILCICGDCESEQSFGIDFDRNTFIKDGKPFQYISGSIHMYRMPREYWNDRLEKMWAAGLNAIETYVFWDQHEPIEGVYNFDDTNDLVFTREIIQ
ncbi:unnamed protein product, partial [Adineta steineri]